MNNDILQRMSELVTEFKSLIDEVRADAQKEAAIKPEELTAHVLNAYVSYHDRTDVYWLDQFGCKCIGAPKNFKRCLQEDYNPYHVYPTEYYADYAAFMKKVNDIQLAYKWCYERDFVQPWGSKFVKSYIVYDDTVGLFKVQTSCHSPATVVFNSKEVAQGCANLLNDMLDREELKFND